MVSNAYTCVKGIKRKKYRQMYLQKYLHSFLMGNMTSPVFDTVLGGPEHTNKGETNGRRN